VTLTRNVNVSEAAGDYNDAFGAECLFEGEAAPFAAAGFTLCVLSPGQPNGMYHAESEQEDCLVLQGECLGRPAALPRMPWDAAL